MSTPYPPDVLIDENESRELLGIPWQDWRQEYAERVRRHFLGEWFHKAHCKAMPLLDILYWMSPIATWGPETQKLREAAALYSNSPYLPENCMTIGNPLYPKGHPLRMESRLQGNRPEET